MCENKGLWWPQPRHSSLCHNQVLPWPFQYDKLISCRNQILASTSKLLKDTHPETQSVNKNAKYLSMTHSVTVKPPQSVQQSPKHQNIEIKCLALLRVICKQLPPSRLSIDRLVNTPSCFSEHLKIRIASNLSGSQLDSFQNNFSVATKWTEILECFVNLCVCFYSSDEYDIQTHSLFNTLVICIFYLQTA